jgi:hypothetical protein
LRPSRSFPIAVSGIACLTVLAIWMSGVPASIAAAMSVAAVLVAAGAWRRQRGLAGGVLRLHVDGSLNWYASDGSELVGRLVDHAVLGPIITLALGPEQGRRRRFALIRDMVDADTWRRLRVALLHRHAADSYRE